jgi:hypothetical protein
MQGKKREKEKETRVVMEKSGQGRDSKDVSLEK